jgi:putative ABC transport system ATP-binding protein
MPSDPGPSRRSTTEAPYAVTCEHVVKVYEGVEGDVTALKGVDAVAAPRSVTALVGPSGAGKSSLLRILAAFDTPTAGSVRIGGIETKSLRPSALRALRRRLVGYVFQRPADNLASYLTLREHLHQAAVVRGRVRGWGRQANELMDALNLSDRAEHLPRELSGGEQQRAAVAIALMGDPTVVVADEPTGELDSASAGVLLTSVVNLARRGTAFVIATHDPDVVKVADRAYHLRHGSVEAEAKDDRRLSVIDDAGRIQLPRNWRRLFPDGRAEIVEAETELRIKPP